MFEWIATNQIDLFISAIIAALAVWYIVNDEIKWRWIERQQKENER